MIMAAKLPVRLRVLIPAVENSVAGNAFQPLDVIKTRKGLTVEIGNTDAEGRLILCDALAEADDEKPDLMIDFATLTGAARVALGTDLPALFATTTTSPSACSQPAAWSTTILWRLPLYQPYAKDAREQARRSQQRLGAQAWAARSRRPCSSKPSSRSSTKWVHIDLWRSNGRTGRVGRSAARRWRFAPATR